MFNEKAVSSFWKHVNKAEANECWNWVGYTNRDGYGNFNVNNTVINSHRVAYMIAYGEIPAKMCVCHKCDNPSCVNPAHLFLASHKDNMSDKSKKGRVKTKSLIESEINEILSSDKSPKLLAKYFGVSGRNISFIKSRKSK